MPATSVLYSTADLARIFQVSEATIRIWRHAGKLPPPVPVGRHFRWEPDQLKPLIRSIEGTTVGVR